MDWIAMVINVSGGLALFLYGMTVMTVSLKEAARGKMKPFLAKMVSNRWKALLAGTGITALIQSSSVTTVLAVGFVSAGLLQFQQTIGIILGSGIGATITAQIVAFKATDSSLVFIAIGFLISSLFSSRVYRETGNFLMGLGLIFLGLNLMSEGTQHLRSYQPFIEAMRNLDNRFLGILIGTVFTAIIQSSSATTGVVIMLCANGLLNLEPAISLVVGANIGTCVTAILSAIGKPRASLQVAMAHVLFKSIGALAWAAFIPQLGHVVEWITPKDIGRQVANAHTIFNVVNAFVMIWFTVPFSKFVKFIVPDKANRTNRVLPNLDPYYLEHSGVSLDLVFEALKKTGEKVLNIARTGFETAMYGNEKKIEQLRKSDEEIDAAYAEIIVFVQSIQQNKLLPQEVRKLNNLTEAANVLETVADLISTNLADSADHRIERQIVLEKETVDELKELYSIALDAFNRAFIEYSEAKPMNHWEEEKDQFKDLVAQVRSKLVVRLSEEQPNQVEKYKLATEVIEVSRQLHAMARRLARKIN